MLFLTAGLGGGTGTGALPVIASIAKKLGIVTVAIVSTPFNFEGTKRMNLALQGLEDVKKNVGMGRITSKVIIINIRLKIWRRKN